MIKFLTMADRIIQKILEYLMIVCMFAMVILIAWQVLCRYVLQLSAGYAEELARLSIVWLIFIGAGLAVCFNDHMNVDVLLKKLPKYAQFVVNVLIYVLIIIYAYVLLVYGINYTGSSWEDHATNLGYSRGLWPLAAPVSGAVMFLYSLVNCVIYIHNFFRPNAKIARRGL